MSYIPMVKKLSFLVPCPSFFVEDSTIKEKIQSDETKLAYLNCLAILCDFLRD